MKQKEQLEVMAKQLYQYFSCLEAPANLTENFVMMNSCFATDTAIFAIYLAMNLPCYHDSVLEVIKDFPWTNAFFEKNSYVKELLISPEYRTIWKQFPEISNRSDVIVELVKKYKQSFSVFDQRKYRLVINLYIEFHRLFAEILRPKCTEEVWDCLCNRLNYIQRCAMETIFYQ